MTLAPYEVSLENMRWVGYDSWNLHLLAGLDPECDPSKDSDNYHALFRIELESF